MNWMTSAFSYAWSSTVGTAIVQTFLALLAVVWGWMGWLLDPATLVRAGMRVMEMCLTEADTYFPSSAHTGLVSLQSWVSGPWAKALIQFTFWAINQLLICKVVVDCFVALMGVWLVATGVRFVVIIINRMWGSD